MTQASGIVFAFFGHPGAGKSRLCRRFGELTGSPAVDTDVFMTAEEVAAVEAGRYTSAMRLANIERYVAEVRSLLSDATCVALADGLPNDEARAYLREQLSGAEVVFVLVSTPRALWERRLSAREGSPVSIDIARADAYVREHWQEPEAGLGHEAVENGEDAAAVDQALMGLYRRYVAGGD